MIRSIFKPSRIRDGKRVRSRIYWGQYRLSLDEPIRRISLCTADKRVAEKRLSELVQEIEQERAGILMPQSFRNAATKPLLEHLSNVIEDLKSRGRSSEYIRKIDCRMKKLIEECGWHQITNVSTDSFITWRNSAALSPRTLNHYLDAAQAVLGWMVMASRISENPLVGLPKVDTRGRETIERRAFTDDEINRLLSSAGKRWPIYLVAVQTGLRFNEIRSLRWGDVKLRPVGQVSIITLRATTTKNRRADVIPLSSGAVEAMRSLWDDSSAPSSPVFAGGMPSHHTMTADIERAGIPKVDDLGRRVDFHALRKTFITNLQRAGVQRRVAMALARHSDGRLTDGVYTDVHALPLADALTRLPGVDMVQKGLSDRCDDAQIDAQEMVTGSPKLSWYGTGGESAVEAQVLERTWTKDEKTCQGESCHDRSKEWSRGESNPRPGIVSNMPLRV